MKNDFTMSYNNFLDIVKKRVLEKMNCNSEEFLTKKFLEVINFKENYNRYPYSYSMFGLLMNKNEEYSKTKFEKHIGNVVVLNSYLYPYQKDFDRDIFDYFGHKKKYHSDIPKDYDDDFNFYINYHLEHFLHGVYINESDFSEQSLIHEYDENIIAKKKLDEKLIFKIQVLNFCYKSYKNQYSYKRYFTYLEDSWYYMRKLETFDDFINYVVNRIVTFSRKCRFYLFVPLEETQDKDDIITENMVSNIYESMQTLSNKQKGIDALNEIVTQYKKSKI